MKLKSIPPKLPEQIYKANVHSTGKIGLAIQTAKNFKISTDKTIDLLIDEDNKQDKIVYGILKAAGSGNYYKITKGGDYHSIAAKSFFDAVGISYQNGAISYNVTEIDLDGQKVLKFEPTKK